MLPRDHAWVHSPDLMSRWHPGVNGDNTVASAGRDVRQLDSVAAAFVDEYYGSCESETVIREDPGYLALRAVATSRPDGRLPVVPLADLESARPGPGGRT